MRFVVLNNLSDDEVEKLLGKLRVEVGPVRQIFEPFDLCGFARGIGRGKVVFGFEFPHSLSVFEPLAQSIDEDRVKTVDRSTMLFEHLGRASYRVSQGPILSV